MDCFTRATLCCTSIVYNKCYAHYFNDRYFFTLAVITFLFLFENEYNVELILPFDTANAGRGLLIPTPTIEAVYIIIIFILFI